MTGEPEYKIDGAMIVSIGVGIRKGGEAQGMTYSLEYEKECSLPGTGKNKYNILFCPAYRTLRQDWLSITSTNDKGLADEKVICIDAKAMAKFIDHLREHKCISY